MQAFVFCYLFMNNSYAIMVPAMDIDWPEMIRNRVIISGFLLYIISSFFFLLL